MNCIPSRFVTSKYILVHLEKEEEKLTLIRHQLYARIYASFIFHFIVLSLTQ